MERREREKRSRFMVREGEERRGKRGGWCEERW